MTKKFFSLFVACLVMVASIYAESAYYTGDGGKDLSIEVDLPQLSGSITDEASWIPDFVVNVLCDDIAKYSAITVVDTNNLDRVIEAQKRTENVLYNQDEAPELGNLSVAKNLLIINITAKSTSYAVSLKVNNIESNTSLAAFNEPNCSAQDLESSLVLKKAVCDLLGQLGVKLTEEGKKSLTDVATQTNTIEAQKNIAKGTAAMQSGSSIEALSYFVKAKNSDNSLKRASVAMSKAGNVVATTDFASNVRNVIKMRKEFIALVDETTAYLNESFPYSVLYSKNLEEGEIDFENETFKMLFKFTPITNFEARELVQNIYAAYLTMPKHEEWGLEGKINSMIPGGYMRITFVATDKTGKEIGTAVYDRSLSGYSVTRYGNGKSGFGQDTTVLVRQGSLDISAEEDTSSVHFGVDSVYFSPKGFKSLSRVSADGSDLYEGEDVREVSITCAPFPDYVERVILPSVELTEICRDVWVPTVSSGLSMQSWYNVFNDFGYEETLPKVVEKKYSFVSLANVMHRYSEAALLRSLLKSDGYGDFREASRTIGRTVVTPAGKVIITNNDKKFPRNIEDFKKVAATTLPFQFVSIPESKDCLFLKNDIELVYMLFELYEMKVENDGYQYRAYENAASVSSSAPRIFLSNDRGNGKSYDLDVFMKKLLGSYFPNVTAIPYTNSYRYENSLNYPNILGMDAYIKHYQNLVDKGVSTRTTETIYGLRYGIHFFTEADVLNVAVKVSDMSRMEVLSHATKVMQKKGEYYFEVTEDFYNTVISVAQKYGVPCSLPAYGSAPRKDWSGDFVKVLNKLTSSGALLDMSKFVVVKDGDLKKLAKDPAGAKIADDMKANANKLYVIYFDAGSADY